MVMTSLEADQPQTVLAPDPDWWRGAVIYQIYPRSFQDSNGDGIGDLSGIIHRLPYLADLGVDGIWISPFFTSPMLDFGYDVSDYRDVDPMFGTLGDFDALIQRAHDLNIRVMIDLVLSHTSDLHPWFKESRSSRDNDKADYYVWAEPKPDGTPPNNWLSIFGGSAWEWDSTRLQYYLHNFLIEQPDLNFHNPRVRQELLDVARFWLERGVDGFRLDTVNFYYHDAELRDNPALTEDQRNSEIAPAVNPYNHQDHLYSKTQPENLGFLADLRKVMDEFADITSVGEVGDAQRGLQVQADYTADGDKLHMCYGFDFLSGSSLDGTRTAEVIQTFNGAVRDGWAMWAFSNHDVIRHASRWHLSEDARRVYSALLMTLKGTVCLYQGDELGLTEAYVAYEDLQDPYGKRFWPKFKGRDGCRTPMPWVADAPHGAFSEAKPWLPMAMEHLPMAVSAQDGDPASMLNFTRAFIAFRRDHPALAKGDMDILEASGDGISFTRSHGNMQVFCAFNLSDVERRMAMPEGTWSLDGDTPFNAHLDGDTLVLPPWQAAFTISGN